MSTTRGIFIRLVFITIAVAAPVATMAGDRIQVDQIRTVRHNLAYGSAPHSDKDYQRLKRLGFTQIIDLRSFNPGGSHIAEKRAKRNGLIFKHIPLGFRPLHRNSLPEIFRQIDSAEKTFIHCQLGRDRTGLIAALYRVRDGVQTPQQSFRQWKDGQFNPLLRGLDKAFWEFVRRWRSACDALPTSD